MITRVQTALDVKTAIQRAPGKLRQIGFDASVLEHGYNEIQRTIEDHAPRSPSPDLDEKTLAVPGGGKIDKAQMVRYC